MDNFSIQEIKWLIEIYFIKLPERLNFVKLGNFLNLRTSDPRFVKIVRFLEDKKILKVVENLGQVKILNLDKERLKGELPEIDFIKYLHDNLINKIYKKTIWIYEAKK